MQSGWLEIVELVQKQDRKSLDKDHRKKMKGYIQDFILEKEMTLLTIDQISPISVIFFYV